MPNNSEYNEKLSADRAQRVKLTRQGFRVKRCHTIPHNGWYSVGHHTCCMMALAYEIFPNDFADLAPYILGHDVPEAWIGDVPAPPKRYSREINKIFTGLEDMINSELHLPLESELEKNRPDLYSKLKDLDWLELWLWCKDELTMGNKNCIKIVEELNKYRIERPLSPIVDEVANHFTGDIIMDTPDCIKALWG